MACYKKTGILLWIVLIAITARGQVTASFSNSTTCGTTSINFTNTSSGATSQTWYFNWPDVTDNSSVANPTKNYPAYGTYQVALAVSGPGGQDTVVKILTLGPIPTVSISRTGPSKVCMGNTVQLSATQNASYTYDWQPASGLSSTAIYNPTAFIDSTITYSLTVKDETSGCTNNGIITIDALYCQPVANFNFFAPACGEFTVDFKDFSQNGYAYKWTFSDPASGADNVSTLKTPSHTFSTTGDFIVTQTVYGKNSNDSNVMSRTVRVFNTVPNGIANNDTTVCNGVTVNLRALGSGSISWTPSDWLSATSGNSVAATPQSPVTYFATLTTGQCTFTDSVKINVNPVPVVDYDVDTACLADEVDFSIKNQSLDSVKYIWNFGDNTMDSGTDVSHTYPKANLYQISVTASRKGCVNKVDKFMTVLQTPNARFSYAPKRIFFDSATVIFTNQSQFATAFAWDFGDGSTSNLNSPVHTYTDTGLYIITMQSFNIKGCATTDSDTIRILPSFYYYIPDAITPSFTSDDKGPAENNVFKVTANAELKEFSMQIFDRWGEKVYIADNNNAGWDGSHTKGGICTGGFYLYSIRFKNPAGVNVYEQGKVMLLK